VVAELVRRGPLGNHVAHLVVDHQELVDAGPPLQAEVVALVAPLAEEELLAADVFRLQVQLHDLVAARLELGLAVRTDLADQSLGENTFERRGDQERFHTHIAQTRDRAGSVVRVQRAEHHVPGQGRLDRDLSRLEVADLADQNLVRVLPQDGPQGVGEGQIDLVVDLAL
jgi:hypothetical protein